LLAGQYRLDGRRLWHRQAHVDPGDARADKAAYDRTAKNLVGLFEKNFQGFSGGVSEDVLAAAIRAAA
jgi:phosphoenolpyruvate carboxykinase (ATP)